MEPTARAREAERAERRGVPEVPRLPEFGLALGGALTTGMAIYHFYLPYAFHWADALGNAPTLAWGIQIINGSFSYLLLAGGLITIAIGLNPRLKDRVARMVIGALALYWILNATCQVVLPMPLPRAFAPMRWGFLGFSVAVTLLYLSALIPGRRHGARPVAVLGPPPVAGGGPGAPR
jgi:hypothetical protein